MKKHKWIVTNRIPTILIIMGYVGWGGLFTLFKTTNNVSVGFIVAGTLMMLAYKWEYVED